MRKVIGLYQANNEPYWRHMSNVRRYFGSMIDFLTQFHPVVPGEVSGQKLCYIRNENMESEFTSVLEHDQSQFWQIVGYKGTGKSTVIRGSFDLWDGSGIQKLVANTLVLYCSFNSVDISGDASKSDIETAVRRVVEGVVNSGLQKVRYEHRRRGGTPVQTDKYVNFLEKIRSDLLYRYQAIPEPGLSEAEIHLKSWEKQDRLTYLATRLKFEFKELVEVSDPDNTLELNRSYLKKQILFVFDDIEGLLEIDARKSLARLITPLWSCLLNGVSFPMKMLIAQRPHTRDELIQSQLWNTITVNFSNSLSLTELINHKTRVWLDTHPESASLKSRETFPESYDWLMSLLIRYQENDHEEIILALSNRCYRDSLERLANCLQNISSDSTYHAGGSQGAFKLSPPAPPISRVNLLDMIGRRGYASYSPNHKNGIANILENRSQDGSGDFLILLCLHWAIVQTNLYSRAWPRLIDFETLRNYITLTLPGSSVSKALDWAIKRSVEMGLVDIVLDQYDLRKYMYHVMPRAEILYNELKENSVLVVLCHSCFYIEEDELARIFRKEMGDFSRATRFIRLVCDFEDKLHRDAVCKTTLWKYVFQQKLLSRHMLIGLEGTWKRWAGDKPVDAALELQELIKSVKMLENKYAK